MSKKYRVIDCFDYKNEQCKLIEYIETEERYSTENDLEANSLCKLLNEQDAEIEQLKEFKNKVFKEINTELSYLTEKAMDNPVNYGRIKALQELKRCVK